MTENSYICRFIEEHPDTWREEMEGRKIRVKEDGDLAIFNYQVDCNFSDPIVQEARGIIINLKTLSVVCWPFRKFGNYTESYADKIDWSTARVQEKIDGSIVKLFYNNIEQKWQWATMSTINAKNATIHDSNETFLDLIHEADNFSNIVECKPNLQVCNTYIFELVSPKNRVVIDYPRTHLYHTGTRSNIDGAEYKDRLYFYHVHEFPSIGEDITTRGYIDCPHEYPLNALDDCVKAATELNDGESCTHEGFVVVDDNWHRVKIKSPEYLMLHRLANNGILTKERAIQMYRSGRDLGNYANDFPNLALPLSYYVYECRKFEYLADKMVNYARSLYAEVSKDRKATAKSITKSKYCSFGFKALDDPNATSGKLLADMSDRGWGKFIDDFKWPKLEDKL